MKMIRNRQKAQDRWDKLRRYVRYTWGSCTLDDYADEPNDACCAGGIAKSFNNNGTLHRRKMSHGLNTISFNRNISFPNEKKSMPEAVQTQGVKSFPTEAVVNPGKISSCAETKPEDPLHKNVQLNNNKSRPRSSLGVICDNQGCLLAKLPPLPSCEYSDSSDAPMADLQQNIEKLYEYNKMLREKLIAALSKDHTSSSQQISLCSSAQ